MTIEEVIASIRTDLQEKFIIYPVAKKRLDLVELYKKGEISLKELNNQWE